MTNPTAILISAVIFAVTGLLLFRWDMERTNDAEVARTHDAGAVYRLDRWTGEVTRCATIVSIPGRMKCEP
jgi:hypothetical protein